MKNIIQNDKDLTLRLSAYAASAGALALIGSSASAQVVHSGLQDIELEMPYAYQEIDLDGDMVNDLAFYMYGLSYYGSYGSYWYDVNLGFGVLLNPKTDGYDNSWLAKTGTLFYSNYSVSTSTYYSTYVPVVDGLDAGATIDSSASLWVNPTSLNFAGVMSYFYYESYYYGSTSWGYEGAQVGDMAGETNFIGVRFWIGTEQHYGWIRVQLGADIEYIRVTDWAYESTAETGINAGDGGDLDGPVVSIYGVGEATPDREVSLTVSADEPLAGIDMEDFSVVNGSATDITMVSDTEFTVDILADDFGMVEVELMAGTVEDNYGNVNEAAAILSYEYIESSDVLDLKDQQGVSIYPNPVSNELHVGLEDEAGIQLINMNGQIVYEQEGVLDHTIDVNGFSPGLYILQVRNDQKIVQYKVVIQ